MKQIIFLLLSLCFSQTWGITEQTKSIYNDLRNIYISDCSLFADYLEDPESIDIENKDLFLVKDMLSETYLDPQDGDFKGQAQTNDGLVAFLKNDDMKSAVSVMGINELMDSLNAFNLNDTIKGVMADFGYPIWYSWATGAKIPIFERGFNSLVNQPITSNKLRAYSWVLLIYLELDPRDSYVVFRTSEKRVIYDYYCYKEEQHPNKFFKWAYCVKKPTEGYAELVQEMDDWLGIVKKHGIDYVRKNKIAPLKTITYEIVEKSLLAPGMDL